MVTTTFSFRVQSVGTQSNWSKALISVTHRLTKQKSVHQTIQRYKFSYINPKRKSLFENFVIKTMKQLWNITQNFSTETDTSEGIFQFSPLRYYFIGLKSEANAAFEGPSCLFERQTHFRQKWIDQVPTGSSCFPILHLAFEGVNIG